MKSSPKVPPQFDNLILALRARFLGLVTGKPQRLVLWLPLHRTPAFNVLLRSNRWKQKELKADAQSALLNARVSP